MALLVILMVCGIQRYLHFSSHSYRVNWIAPYYRWWEPRLTKWSMQQHVGGLLLLILPLLVLMSFLFTLTHVLLGVFGYFTLSLIWFWYCVSIRQHNIHSNESSEQVISQTYRQLFAIIFWYFVFGPIGLALYVGIVQLLEYLQKQTESQAVKLKQYTATVLAVLDWLPVRLVGLSFALVGHFSAVFRLWSSQLLTGISDDYRYLVELGLQAIDTEAMSVTNTEGVEASLISALAVEHLLDRSLLVWLVVMALCSIGYWLG